MNHEERINGDFTFKEEERATLGSAVVWSGRNGGMVEQYNSELVPILTQQCMAAKEMGCRNPRGILIR